MRADRRLIRIEAPNELVGRLVYGGPVKVAGYRGRVVRQDPGRFDVEMFPEDAARAEIRALKPDSKVRLMAEPTFQFRCEVNVVGSRPSSVYRALEIYRPNGEPVYANPERNMALGSYVGISRQKKDLVNYRSPRFEIELKHGWTGCW